MERQAALQSKSSTSVRRQTRSRQQTFRSEPCARITAIGVSWAAMTELAVSPTAWKAVLRRGQGGTQASVREKTRTRQLRSKPRDQNEELAEDSDDVKRSMFSLFSILSGVRVAACPLSSENELELPLALDK